MTIFEENVTPVFTTDNVNFLTVVEMYEEFYDLYKIKINNEYYIAEKTGEYNGFPIVTIPVYFEGYKAQTPFVIRQGDTQEIIFNKDLTHIPTKLPIKSVKDIIQEGSFEEVEQYNLSERVDAAKTRSIDYSESRHYIDLITEQHAQDIKNFIEEKDSEITNTLQNAKIDLLNEFNTIADNLSKVTNENAEELQKSITEQLGNAANKLKRVVEDTTNIKEQGILASLSENISYIIDNEIKPALAESNKDHEIFIGEIATNINNEVNKTVANFIVESSAKIERLSNEFKQLADSNLDKQLVIVDEKLANTAKLIGDTYNTKFAELVKSSSADKNKQLKIFEENRQAVLKEIRAIKKQLPSIIAEGRDANKLRASLEQSFATKLNTEVTNLKRYISLSSGGGSSGSSSSASGVTAGSYTFANITVDESGRITAASNGMAFNGTVGAGTPNTGVFSAGASAGLKVMSPSGNANDFVAIGQSGNNRAICSSSNALGLSYQLLGDNTGSGGPMELRMGSGATFTWQSTARSDAGSTDLTIGRKSAANLRQGAADAASPVSQTSSVQNVLAGTTNTPGAARYIDGSQSTGNQNGGSIIFRTSGGGAYGSAQNALVDRVTINSSGVSMTTDFAAAGDITSRLNNATAQIKLGNNGIVFSTSNDVNISRTAAGALALGTGAAGSTAGSLSLSAITASGAITASANGAASTPAVNITGVPFAGTGTTSFPLVYINETGATASTTLNTAGTLFGVNGNGTADLMNLLKDGVSQCKVSSGGVLTATGGLTIPVGSVAGNAATNSGLYNLDDYVFAIKYAGSYFMGFFYEAFRLSNNSQIAWSSTASINATMDTYIGRKSAADLRQGAADAAAPVAQTFSVQNVATGNSNVAGAPRYIDGCQSTGDQTGGSIIFRTAPAGGAGSSQNALAAALTIAGSGAITLSNTTASTNKATGALIVSGGLGVSGAVNSGSTIKYIGTTANDFISIGGSASLNIFASSNALGAHYQLIGDSTGSGGPAILRFGSGATIQWQSTTRADAGSSDTSISRLSSGVVAIGTGAAGSAAGSLSLAGITASGPLITTPQALSGAGAVNITTGTTAFTSTGAAQALTLADGTNGQIKTIVHVAAGGSGVLTPTTKSGYTTITFTNVGDSVTLQFFTGAGWCITGIFGAVAA